MSSQAIYNKFRAVGFTHSGACGMLGNLMAESSLISNIAQRGMTTLSDDEYTAKFNRTPETCYKDGIGYGLAQWTFWSRKRALWEFSNNRDESVGNEAMQTDFIIHELRTDYPALFSFLCSTDDLYAATDRICREYERPAVNNVDRRYSFANVFANDLAPTSTEEAKAPSTEKWFPPDLSILTLQSVLVGNGYNVEITGYKTADFIKTLKQFVEDIS